MWYTEMWRETTTWWIERTVPPVAENVLDLMRSDFSHRKIGDLDEFLVKKPMTHIFFCQPWPRRWIPCRRTWPTSSARWCWPISVRSGGSQWRVMCRSVMKNDEDWFSRWSTRTRSIVFNLCYVCSQHVHYLEVATPTLSIVVSSSCFQSLVFLRVMMTLLILLYIIYDKHDDTM